MIRFKSDKGSLVFSYATAFGQVYYTAPDPRRMKPLPGVSKHMLAAMPVAEVPVEFDPGRVSAFARDQMEAGKVSPYRLDLRTYEPMPEMVSAQKALCP